MTGRFHAAEVLVTSHAGNARGPAHRVAAIGGGAVVGVGIAQRRAVNARREMAEAREEIAQHGPDHGDLADVDGDAGLAHVPEHVVWVIDVGEVEDLGHEGGDDDKDAEGKDEHEDDLLAPGQAQRAQEWKWDPDHQEVGGDVEAALNNGVVLEGGALWVGRGHGPVTAEGTTGGEEGHLSGEPAYCYVGC